MRILVFTWEFPPILGGAGAFARDLCLAFGEMGHSVTVLTADFSDAHAAEQERDDRLLRTRGVEVVRMAWPHPLGFFTVPIRLKAFLKERRGDFDLFLVTESKAQAVASKLPSGLLGEYSVVIHGSELPRHFDDRPWWLRLCYSAGGMRSFLGRARSLMGISGSTVDWVSEYGFRSSKITLGVDPATFYPEPDSAKLLEIRRSFGMAAGERAIVSACRLEPDKGSDVLIRAFSGIAGEFPEASVWIAGDGEDRARLQSIAQEAGVSGRVHLTGTLPRPRLRQLIQAGEFFAMITRRMRLENFGLVFIEANACGKAVLGGRTGGVPDAVEDGVSGLLVDPASVEEARAALRRLLGDPDFRRSLEAGAERRYRSGFTHIHTARQILECTGVKP